MKARSIFRLTALYSAVLSLGVASGCAATPEEPRAAASQPEMKDASREAVGAREGAPRSFRPGPELERLRQQLREAEESGREKQAAEIRERIATLERQQVARGERRPTSVAPERLERLERKIDELRQAGRHDEAQQLERQLDRARGTQSDRPPGEPGGAAEGESQRRQHLREAIGHLHAAGMHVVADRLERQADRMRQDFEVPPEGRAPEPPMRGMERLPQADLAELQANLQELREQMRAMQRALEEIRQQPGKRAPDRR